MQCVSHCTLESGLPGRNTLPVIQKAVHNPPWCSSWNTVQAKSNESVAAECICAICDAMSPCMQAFPLAAQLHASVWPRVSKCQLKILVANVLFKVPVWRHYMSVGACSLCKPVYHGTGEHCSTSNSFQGDSARNVRTRNPENT